jgi:hypothetical protein
MNAIRCLLITFFVGISLACQNDSTETRSYTVQKAGPSTPLSTKAQVYAAFDRAYQTMTSSNDFIEFLADHEVPYKTDLNLTEQGQVQVVLNAITAPGDLLPLIKAGSLPDSPTEEEFALWNESYERLKKKYPYPSLKEYIKLEQIEFLEDASCDSQNKIHADIRVDSFEVGARICVSIQSLTRLAPADLEKNITASLVRQLAHMFGYSERISLGVQARTLLAYEAFLATIK